MNAGDATSPDGTGPEEDRLQELLAQAGLNSLRFPSNVVLSPQWKAFLGGLGPKQSPTGAPTDKPTDKKWARRGSTGTKSSKD